MSEELFLLVCTDEISPGDEARRLRSDRGPEERLHDRGLLHIRTTGNGWSRAERGMNAA
jgi:hypothetical protein